MHTGTDPRPIALDDPAHLELAEDHDPREPPPKAQGPEEDDTDTIREEPTEAILAPPEVKPRREREDPPPPPPPTELVDRPIREDRSGGEA